MAKTARALVVVLMIVGCGGGDPANPDAELPQDALQPDASLATRTVRGTSVVHRVTPGGVVDVPVDLSTTTIAAVAGQTEYAGTGSADGSFSIPDVPAGEVYVRVGKVFYATAADTIDLGHDALGRADAVDAQPGTELELTVANLAPWQDTDLLELFAESTGTSAFAMQLDAIQNPPVLDATSLDAFDYDLVTAYNAKVLDAAAGDVARVTQLATRSDGANAYQSASRTLALSVTTPSPGVTTVDDAFTTVPQTQVLAFTWDRPAFDAMLRAAVPNQEPESYKELFVHALPDATTRGFYDASADALIYDGGFTADASTLSGSWSYGDPYPPAWTRLTTFYYYTFRYSQVGTASLAQYAFASVDHLRSDITPGTPVTPTLGPPTNPTIGGQDAFVARTGVGTTPTVAWTAPAIGTPVQYVVGIREVHDAGGYVASQSVGAIRTTATSITVPSGLLEAGKSYVFNISAVVETGVDLTAHPGQLGLPSAYASIETTPAMP